MKKKITPKIMPGFMELLPAKQLVFERMKQIVQEAYESYGFVPLDTPILELSEVLLAKAGGETEKQIYRFTKGDTDISMRFDLTVPFSRFVAKNQILGLSQEMSSNISIMMKHGLMNLISIQLYLHLHNATL